MAARTSLLDFSRFTKQDGYVDEWFHRVICRELDALVAGERRRLVIVAPPQQGKSEPVSRRLPAYVLGRDPDEKIIACSYAAPRAEANSVDVQRIIESEPYRMLFPGTRLAAEGIKGHWTRTKTHFEVVGRQGEYRCAGIGGGISGNPATLGIVDDPFKGHEEAWSPTIRQKVWDWYCSEFLARLGSDGRVVVIMTRWHRDDLVGRLLRMEPERWRVVRFPALRESVKTHPEDPREEGEALWEAKKSRALWEAERALNRAVFTAVGQGDPAEAGGTDWPPSLFRDVMVGPDRWPVDFDVRIVALDPSKGKSDKQGDYAALIFLGFKDRLLWVDAEIERIPLNRLTNRLIVWCDQWKPDALGIEAEAFQEFLCVDLERASQGRFGIQWTPTPMLSGGVKKEVRIRRLSPYLVDRKIRFRNTPGCRLLIEQLLDFPTGEHDDGPDALEMAVRLASEVCVATR